VRSRPVGRSPHCHLRKYLRRPDTFRPSRGFNHSEEVAPDDPWTVRRRGRRRGALHAERHEEPRPAGRPARKLQNATIDGGRLGSSLRVSGEARGPPGTPPRSGVTRSSGQSDWSMVERRLGSPLPWPCAWRSRNSLHSASGCPGDQTRETDARRSSRSFTERGAASEGDQLFLRGAVRFARSPRYSLVEGCCGHAASAHRDPEVPLCSCRPSRRSTS
jgi:hypothetical protein